MIVNTHIINEKATRKFGSQNAMRSCYWKYLSFSFCSVFPFYAGFDALYHQGGKLQVNWWAFAHLVYYFSHPVN